MALSHIWQAIAKSGKTIQQLLREALTANATRVVDLFRDWDVDGNGTISRREFRGAIIALGYTPPMAEVRSAPQRLAQRSAAAGGHAALFSPPRAPTCAP